MSDNKLDEFRKELVKDYPSSNKKLSLDVRPYSIKEKTKESEGTAVSTFISPHGVEFQSHINFDEGSLIKVDIPIPNYWDIKTRFITYTRIDKPATLSVIAKIISSEEVGKKKQKAKDQKKLFLAQILNIDEVDEIVLKTYLSDEK